jgi:hypothetical protein
MIRINALGELHIDAQGRNVSAVLERPWHSA